MDDFLTSVEGLEPGDKVELFSLDLNPIGHAVVIRWTPSRQDGLSLWWKGEEYLSRPIQATGFKKSGQDKPPEPVLTISNIDQGGFALLNDYGELYGAILTRWTTFSKYLDKHLDGTTNPGANGSAAFLPEIWEVEQLSGSDPTMIQWRLRSSMDIRNKTLPNRRAYRDVCQREYRSWNGSTFDYSTVKSCPYAGSLYYKRDGTATSDPAEDACTYDLGGCELRFPDEPLPGWFFPGLQRF